jgi:hypothetical protein
MDLRPVASVSKNETETVRWVPLAIPLKSEVWFHENISNF